MIKDQQLIALIKCVLSLNHGNAVPERGVSINNILLEAHGYTIKNDTIVALRIVKDELRRVGGVVNFKFTKELIDEVKGARSKYMADLEEKKALKEKERIRKKVEVAASAHETEEKEESHSTNLAISKCELSLKSANEVIEDTNANLQKALSSSKLNRNMIQQAQSKIEIGIERKRKLEGDIETLKKKQKLLLKTQSK